MGGKLLCIILSVTYGISFPFLIAVLTGNVGKHSE